MVELLMDRKMLRGVVFGLVALAVLSFAAGLALGIRRSLPSTTTQSASVTPISESQRRDPALSPREEPARQAAFAASDRDRVVVSPADDVRSGRALDDEPPFRAAAVSRARAVPGPRARDVRPSRGGAVTVAASVPVAVPDADTKVGMGAGSSHGASAARVAVSRLAASQPPGAREAAAPAARLPTGDPESTRRRVHLDDNLRLAYTVQAGAFVDHGNAHAHARELSGRGYATRIVGVRVASGRVFALVLVGGYAGFSEAVRTADELDAEGFSAFARSNVAGEESQVASGASG